MPMIRLTNAYAGKLGKPLAVNTEHIIAFGTEFETEVERGENCRLELRDENTAIVCETFDQIWDLIHPKKAVPRRGARNKGV